MSGAQWFTASVGRNKRAEPRWLLPLICKAGGITRDDVGSIKILDEETRFEISAEKSAEFAERVARIGSGEKGVTISPADGRPRETRQDAPAPRKAWQTPRPVTDEAPAGEAAPDSSGKPAKRSWLKGDFGKAAAKGKPGKGDFKGKKPFGAKGPAKYKSKPKGPK
jgi:ATP-dependent RNA helicase DeaD